MQILSKDGMCLFNTDLIRSLYISSSQQFRNTAIRCGFSVDTKDLTVATYDTTEQAKMALKYIGDNLARGADFVQMPGDDEIEQIARRFELKERALNGKKTVRRGGS